MFGNNNLHRSRGIMLTYNYILKMNNLTSFILFSALMPFCDVPCLYVIGYLQIHQV